MNLKTLSMQVASEAFATKRLPSNWGELSVSDQDEWLSSHRYEPFESLTNDAFYTLICDHAGTIELAFNHVICVPSQSGGAN